VTSPAAPSWVVYPRLIAEPDARLFCIGHAGSGAAHWRAWPAHFGAGVELGLVRLPGRESRLGEEPFTDMAALTAALADGMAAHLGPPFSLYGDCSGALVAFELARELRRRGWRGPGTLSVWGCRAPHLPQADGQLSDLPSGELVDRLAAAGGPRAAALRHPALRDLVLPGVRADIRILETYRYRAEAPLACAVRAIWNRRDPDLAVAHLEAWADHTSADFSLEVVAVPPADGSAAATVARSVAADALSLRSSRFEGG
jgi:medium-chain acyl-[acyl-carrier-protein] hydrolase